MEEVYYCTYEKGDIADYYRGTSLLPTTYSILSNILVSKLTPYVLEIVENRQRGF
jgi:hypothetical protein